MKNIFFEDKIIFKKSKEKKMVGRLIGWILRYVNPSRFT